MTDFAIPHTFLFALQGIAFSVLSFVFFMYYRTFSQQYVQYWLFGLLALTFNYFVKAIISYNALILSQNITVEYWQTFPDLLIQVSQYLVLFFLVLGVFNAKTKQEIPRYIFIFVFSSILLFPVLSSLIFYFKQEKLLLLFYLNVSLPSFIYACVLFTLATYLLTDKKSYFSSTLLMWFCFIVGLRYLFHSFISIVAVAEAWFRQFELFLLYFDITSYGILGFILLIWLQGAERFYAASAINKAQYLGKHDRLTGALNRDQVMKKLSEKMTKLSGKSENNQQVKLSVFLIDIKQFKFINDTYGLKVGDYILGEIANRLNNSVFIPQAVGRLSGDSFMFVVEFEQLSHIERAVQHLHELISRPYMYKAQEIHIEASIGYCFYPDNADTAEDLLQKANLALHHAETNNIASVYFSEGMQAQGRRLLVMEKELKSALANDEFILYYQPQLNLLTNKLEGVEALVRWQHPEKGLLSPIAFLADMEALGMHSLFDNHILAKACQASARWFDTYKRRIAIAVNITAVEFQDEKLVSNMQTLLSKYHIPSKYIELEITENVVMTDIERAMDNIVKLQNMGIKVSIDDFGTGYSSLTYLRELPIDKIKIDRSFIKEVASNDSDLTIVKSMIELSHGLGKRVLAEGVETLAQLNVVRNLGCDAVQGFFVDKPLPEADLVRYLERK